MAMNLLKSARYWKNVESAYETLGGTYKVIAQDGSKSKVPTDPARYAVARLLAVTGKRVCSKCSALHDGQPGEVYRHCETIMHADLTVAEREAVLSTVGKLKIRQAVKSDRADGSAAIDKAVDEKSSPPVTTPAAKVDTDEAKAEPKIEKSDKKELHASFVKDDDNLGDSYWIIKAGGEPVLKVTLAQAFPNNINTKAAQFSTPKYGETLLKKVQQDGTEKTMKTALNNRATLFKAGQINPLAPNIFQDQTSVEDQDQQGQRPTGEQADEGLVDNAVGDEILDEKDDNADIIETIKEALVPILKVADELTVDQLVQELKMLVQNDDALNEFQGSLQEMVDQSQESAHIDSAEDEAVEEDLADAGGSEPPPDQQPMATAMRKDAEYEVVKLREELVKSRKSARSLYEQLEKRERQMGSVREDNIRLKDENKMLLAERTMRVRHPRCLEVARKQVAIGEAEDEHLQVMALLRMPTEQFEATEDRVDKIHQRVGFRTEAADLDTQGVLSVIPEQRDEGKKEASLVSGPRSGSVKPKLSSFWTGAQK